MSNTIPAATRVVGIVKIEIRDEPAQDYLGARFTSPMGSVGESVQTSLADLYERLQMTGAVPSGPPFLIASPPAGGSMEIEVGAPCVAVPVPAPGQHAGRLAAGKAAVALFRGPYAEIGNAYATLFKWAGENGYRPAGAPREVYLNGPRDVEGPADFLTEIVLPVV